MSDAYWFHLASSFPPLMGRDPYNPQNAERPRDQGEKPEKPARSPQPVIAPPEELAGIKVTFQINDALDSLWKAFMDCHDKALVDHLLNAIGVTKEAEIESCKSRKKDT